MVTLLVVCGLVCWGVAGSAVVYVVNGGHDLAAAGVVVAGMALTGGVFLYAAWWVQKQKRR